LAETENHAKQLKPSDLQKREREKRKQSKKRKNKLHSSKARRNTATTGTIRVEQKLHNPSGWEKANPTGTTRGNKTALAQEEPEEKISTGRKEAQGHPLPVKPDSQTCSLSL
jgi:hypothetical protein